MPIDADKVRELAARSEGETLDYKRDDYDWTRAGSNAELAKDIMAIANKVRRGDPPGYILIGVQNDKTIVGIAPTSHQDDASLHQRVRGFLNRTPEFSYVPVDIDGLSVGVYEIRGGARPYYPLKDATPSLRRHVAMYRNGSGADEASPTMILEWAQQDDPSAHRLRDLELRKLEAESLVHGRITYIGVDYGSRSVGLEIENLGRCGFWIDRLVWRVEWTEEFHNARLSAGWDQRLHEVIKRFDLTLEDVLAPMHEFTRPRETIVPAGHVIKLGVPWAFAELANAFSLAALPEFSTTWYRVHFEITCRGDLGGEGAFRSTFNPP
ncbi:MAG TPA: ATP-binding protein [Kofleriaceae bacterium]